VVYVSKIELRGFKSFGNKKTVLPLSPGLTAIVGPNGCGKSNVIEAFSFVLGQLSAKTMRAEKFSDLIFNGGNGGRAAPFAEVSLYLDNSRGELPVDAKTVKISRRVSRNGKCAYWINNKRAPRQRVIELLGGIVSSAGGYNFIMQGDVDRFIKMSSLERRRIVDDMAGVAEFDEKKEKAMSELEKVESHLQTMKAALGEIERQMESLRSQRDDAIRFKELKKQLEEARASLLFTRRDSHRRKISKLQEKLDRENELLGELRKKREKLEADREKLEKEEEKLTKFIEKEGSSGSTTVQKLGERLHTLREALISTRGRYKSLGERAKDLGERIKKLSEELERRGDLRALTELSSEFSRLRRSFDELAERFEEEKSPLAIKEILSELRGVLSRMHSIIDEVNIQLKKVLSEEMKPPREKIENKIEELRELRAEHRVLVKQQRELEEMINEFERKIKETRKSLEVAKMSEKETKKSIRDARKKRQKLQVKLSQVKSRILQISDKIDGVKDRLESYRVEKAGLEAELKMLESEWEKLKDKAPEKPMTNVYTLERRIRKIESELEALEPVNMKAPQEYEMTKRRYNSEREKYDKLIGEKQALMDFMEEIERKKTEVFMETFDKISKNFTKIFETLSPGGTAKLVLENPNAPLEGGLEIEARPAGKRVLRADAMSGGEKALTAVAFIFALQRVKPATIYVMDEIDAHLDPQNLKRVAKMLKESSKKSQTIVATLRDPVMSAADRLFGVNMDKNGESHIVSVELTGMK